MKATPRSQGRKTATEPVQAAKLQQTSLRKQLGQHIIAASGSAELATHFVISGIILQATFFCLGPSAAVAGIHWVGHLHFDEDEDVQRGPYMVSRRLF